MQNEKSFRLQQFVDPLFGSERYLTFEADWVAEMTEGTKWIIFRPRLPVTYLKFKNGTTYTVHGHWAQAIKDAMEKTNTATQ